MKKKENAFAPLVGKAVVCCYFTISYHSHSRCAELPETNSQEEEKKTKQIRITKISLLLRAARKVAVMCPNIKFSVSYHSQL